MSLPRVKETRLSYFGKMVPTPIQQQAHEWTQKGLQYVGIAGGSRSGKSIWLVNENIDLSLRNPGYTSLLSRWTDDATKTIIAPLFYDVVRNWYHPDILGEWVAKEERQYFANGSSVYIHGLKSGDDSNRYAKFDGLELGGVFLSQAEELPKDVWERLKTRLSQKGVPRHMLFELNPTSKDHYLYDEFERAAMPDHKLLHASMFDNARNLPDGYIAEMEAAYPPGHPLRKRLIEGAWGMTARGEPVIGPGLFNTDLHVSEKMARYDPNYPLLLSYDPGVQHCALTWAQVTPKGHLRILDCLLGTDAYADEFFAEAFQQQRETFGEVKEIRACADRASQQRKGNYPKTEWDIFAEHLRPWQVTPLTGVVASKPFLIQRLASRFTRLIQGQPAIVLHPRCEYLIEGLTQGWVWRPGTDLRPNQRVPAQDGWYEHGCDTLTYLEMHFGPGVRKISKVREEDDRPRRPRKRATAAGW